MRHSFIKESIGFNPLLGRRDWLLFFGGLCAVVLLWEWVLQTPPAHGWDVRIPLLGAITSGTPSVIACLPVHGKVAAERVGSFMDRLARFGFVQDGEAGEGRIYKLKTPRWCRWDSNRVVIRTTNDGALQVTAPLHFYRRLKRLQS